MSFNIPENNIAELEAQINAFRFKNSELEVKVLEFQTNITGLKTSHQLLSKKAEWFETELAMSKHHCALLKNTVYGKRSEKSKDSYTGQMSLLFNEAEAYAEDEEDKVDSESKQNRLSLGHIEKVGARGYQKIYRAKELYTSWKKKNCNVNAVPS